MRANDPPVFVVLLWLAVSAAAFADDVFLTNGGMLVGHVKHVGDKIHVEQASGVVILDKEKVLYVEEKTIPLDAYNTRLHTLNSKQGTAVDFSELGRFAVDNSLKIQAEAAFRRAMALDPNNSEARAALGFLRHEGKWLSPDEAAQAKGLVKHNGGWITPELRAETIRLEANRAESELERVKLELIEKELQLAESIRAKAEADAARAKAIQHRRRSHTHHNQSASHHHHSASTK